MSKRLSELVVGDYVLRWLGGLPQPMRLPVKQVRADRIVCLGGWEFDRKTGAEINEDLGWGRMVLPVPLLNRNQTSTQEIFGDKRCTGWPL